jgi:hypothetical protein
MKKINLILVILLFSGCHTPVTYITSTIPDSHEIPDKTTFLFDQSKQVTWDNLLSVLANSEFSIDKLNVHAYNVKVRMTGQPDLYIDCGRKKINTDGTIVTVINARRNYSYTAYQHIHLETYTYTNNFTGFANLFITGNNISSKVMVQYELELQTEEKKTSTRGRNFSSDLNVKLQLNSNKPVHSSLFKATCQSTGNLERKILDIMASIPDSVTSTATKGKPHNW